MAEKELRSIQFPGLEDRYVVPEGGGGGAPGPAGKDGITPTIGANGNWYLGDIDTQKPSRGEKGADGAAGKDGSDGYSPEATVTPINGGAKIIIKDRNGTTSANVMNGAQGPQGPKGDPGATDFSLGITGAQVGQIAKITAVDASGKPTKWEPVEMGGGGGGSSNDYEFIQSFKLSPDTAVYELADVSKYSDVRVNVVRTAPNSNLGTGNLFSQIAIKDDPAKVFNMSLATSVFKNAFYFCEMSCGKEYSASSLIAGGNNKATLSAGIGFGCSPELTTNYDEVLANLEKCCYRLFYQKPTECIDGNETVYVYGVRR